MPGKDYDWRDDAICATSGYPDEWHLEHYSAKKLCHGCPVISECLTYALDTDQEWGIWGGMTSKERRTLKRRTNKFLSLIETLKPEQSLDDIEHPTAS